MHQETTDREALPVRETTDFFPDHTLESAPAGSRRAMEATTRQFGHLPAPVARLATSPRLLEGFLHASALFEKTTLDPIAREVIVLTVAVRNDCHVCVAMHTAKLKSLGAAPDLVAALSDQQVLPDSRLEALRVFTLAVLDRAGAVSDARLEAFADAGFTREHALEVVLGVGAYTMSTFANRMTRAPWEARPSS